MAPAPGDVFAAWDRAGVRWCRLRDDGERDRGSGPTGDVDILVAPEDVVSARTVALVAGFVPLRAYGRGTHRFLLAYDRSTDRWVELDLVTEAAFGAYQQYRLTDAATLLGRRVRAGTGWAPGPVDRFWLLLLHCLLDKRTIAPRHASALTALADRAGDAVLAAAPLAPLPRGWSPARVLSAVRAPASPALGELGARLAVRLRWRSPRRVAGRVAVGAVLRRLERPLAARQRRGIAVAVIGPDGVGKSTLLAGLARSAYFPTRMIYMGMWQRGVAPVGALSSPGEITARPLIVWARYLSGVRHRLLGRLVLFDRYTYDALIPPRPPYVWLKRPYFWLLAHLCPAPDLVLLLDAPGRVMFERKGEFDAAHLDAERRHFRRIAARLRNVHVLDASQPAETVRVDATALIWQWYAERLRRHAPSE